MVLLDNTEAQCERLPVTEHDVCGNGYQMRETQSGRSYRVVKNFPTEDELREVTRHVGVAQSYTRLEHFWLFEYEVAQAPTSDSA